MNYADRSRPMGSRWAILALIVLFIIALFNWIANERFEKAFIETREESIRN